MHKNLFGASILLSASLSFAMDQNQNIEENLCTALADCSSLCKTITLPTTGSQEVLKQHYAELQKNMELLEQKKSVVTKLLKQYDAPVDRDVKTLFEEGLTTIQEIQELFEEAKHRSGCDK